MNRAEKLFVNNNYVRGVQKFLKQANLVKYANEDAEMVDAAAVSEAMADSGMDIPAEEAMADNAVLEVANTLVELAQEQPAAAKAKIEDAAAQVAEAVEPSAAPAEPAGDYKDMDKEANAKMNKLVSDVKTAKELAGKFADYLADSKNSNDELTEPNPSQVLSISGTDYQVADDKHNAVGTGSTDLKTEKGEVGAQENVEAQISVPKDPDADMKQNSEEGKDIYGKDYATNGIGGTDVKTEKGEVGAEDNVDHKLAALSMQTTLAKLLGK